MGQDRVVVVKLVENGRFQTGGGASQPTEVFELPLGRYSGEGPKLAGIRIYAVIKNKAGNAQVKVISYWSNDGSTWSSASDLCSNMTADGQYIHGEVTDKLLFGLRMKFALAVSVSSGSGADSLIASIWAAFRYQD